MNTFIKPMLCKDYEPSKLSLPVYVSPKKDGVRCQLIKNKGEPTKAFFRSGNPIIKSIDNLLKEIDEELSEFSFVLEGELVTYTAQGQNSFQITSGLIRQSLEDVSDRTQLFVFDFLKYKHYDLLGFPFETRNSFLRAHGTYYKSFAILPQILCKTEKAIDKYYKKALDSGEEGIVIKEAYSYYQEGKRPWSCQKRKPQPTLDLKVIAWFTGNKGTKYEKAFGGIIIKLPNGKETRVGSGFSDAQRKEFFEEPEKILNKTVEVAYMDLTDAGRLRQPIFKSIRYDK